MQGLFLGFKHSKYLLFDWPGLHLLVNVIDEAVAAKLFICLVAGNQILIFVLLQLMIMEIMIVDSDDLGAQEAPLAFPYGSYSHDSFTQGLDQQRRAGGDLCDTQCHTGDNLQGFQDTPSQSH